MKMNEIVQLVLFFGLLIGLTPLLGRFMARVFQGQKTFLQPLLRPVERLVYWTGGVNENAEMSWKGYFAAVLIFNVVGILSLMALMMSQKWLPLNPQQFDNVPWALALNTAISFITNTNWQNYAGETTMSYLTQMAGLAVHNFLSAATGIAVLLAVVRGLTRASAKTLGNFWVDLTRATLYVLLPLSLVLAVALNAQGVVQNFKPYATANLLVESYTDPGSKNRRQRPACHDQYRLHRLHCTDGRQRPARSFQWRAGHGGCATKRRQGECHHDECPRDGGCKRVTTQMIPTGPAASQIAIKHLGTNGGGFLDRTARTL
jgi:K+-transporting ATPase ATPase A chain